MPNKTPAIICDIDGTAAQMKDRSPYDYTKVLDDLPSDAVRNTLYALRRIGYELIYVSGRPGSGKIRGDTLEWLVKHSFPKGELFMRPDKDMRPDNEVKLEIYIQQIKPRYDILLVLDDRNRVVKMWRQQGLTCFQVAEGDF